MEITPSSRGSPPAIGETKYMKEKIQGVKKRLKG
jgi:hypothetical protein